jgi:hypothetical protein
MISSLSISRKLLLTWRRRQGTAEEFVGLDPDKLQMQKPGRKATMNVPYNGGGPATAATYVVGISSYQGENQWFRR